jgi:hypothetical protein
MPLATLFSTKKSRERPSGFQSGSAFLAYYSTANFYLSSWLKVQFLIAQQVPEKPLG